jgi:predicted nucleic acid-binding protein
MDIRFFSGLKIPDSFIVATALDKNTILITTDKKILKLKWPGLDVRSIF